MKTGDPVTLIVPPRIQAMMTGAWKLEVGAHDARLTYTDGTWEEVPASLLRDIDGDDWFRIVSTVQSQRKAVQ